MTPEIELNTDEPLVPPLLVRLVRDVNNVLPADYALQLDETVAHALVMRRLAVPVADFNTVPDAIVECTIDDLGLRAA